MTVAASPVSRLLLVTTDLDALLRQVAQRDVDAFAAFYDLTRARVFGLVTRVLRDPGYSEETTQDVYLQVWRNAANYDLAAGSPLAWLMTVAHRRAVDRVRAEQAATQPCWPLSVPGYLRLEARPGEPLEGAPLGPFGKVHAEKQQNACYRDDGNPGDAHARAV